jgi:cytochrome c556
MKNSLLVTSVVIIVILGAGVWLLSNNNDKNEKEGLPSSIDQYYQSKPPVYLISMFELGAAMMGIGVNLQQGDTANAKKSYDDFFKKFKDSSNMVPEWKKFYDQGTVEKIGASLDSGDMPAVFENIGKVGEACAKCHMEKMPQVWNNYNWNNFGKLTLNTPNPAEPVLPFPAAKIKYLAAGFDGIGVNIKNNNQKGAQESFGLFKTMFDNMNTTCSSCHASAPKYYVSADIQAMIDTMGEKINSGNLSEAEGLRMGIGMESCYRCHVLHMPSQYARAASE